MKTQTVLNILLAAFLIFAVVPASSVASSAAQLSPDSPDGATSVPKQASESPSTAELEGDPVEVWSISWKATTVISYKVDQYNGNHSSLNYNFTGNGSLIARQYADNTWDNINFKFHIADEYHRLDVEECDYTAYMDQHTIDPDRYDGNQNELWYFGTTDNPEEGWRGFIAYGINYIFTVNRHQYGWFENSDCSFNFNYDSSDTLDEAWNPTCLLDSTPLLGNVQGTEFNYHAEGIDTRGCTGPSGTGPSDAQWNWNVDVTVRLLAGRDLTVDRLEVTQGLQDGANSIPLVQGRRTVVRAFLNIGVNPGPVDGVTGVLEGYAGGAKLGSVTPFNGNISAPNYPDWKKINDTLNFELPLAWTQQPSLHLTVKVNPNHTVVEENYDNNELSADVSPLACQGISIGYTPVHYDPPFDVAADPSAKIQFAQEFMQKIFPVSEKGIIYQQHGAMWLYEDINRDGIDDSFINSLVDVLLISRPHPDHIYGWLPSLAYDGNGYAENPGVSAFGNDTEPDRWRRTFAHEMGHNLGLPDLNLLPLTTDGDHWFDVYDRVIKPVPAGVEDGDKLLDFMVPGQLESEAWISPQNYRYLIYHMCSSAAAAAPVMSSLMQGNDSLLVTGSISNSTPTTASLDPLLQLLDVPMNTLPVGWQYCVRLRDASGNLLSHYCFDPSFEGDSTIPADSAPFSMVVPYPAGLNRIELTETLSGSVLSSQIASANIPSVTVISPNAARLTLSGSQTIAWTGSDLDNDPLTYAVLYSNNNGTNWTGVGAGITETSYSLDFSTLAGTTGASGLIKVMVSDGFYTVEDTSDNTFTVDNKPPSAIILSPSSGASFITGPQIVLESSGMDFEDGPLGDSALSWVSSQDGVLGNGQILEVTLSPGVHTITLTATDSEGLQDTDSIQVTVVQGTTEHYLFLPLIIK